MGVGTANTEFRLLGGRATIASAIVQTSTSKFVLNQAGAMSLGWRWATNSATDTVELRVNSAADFQVTIAGATGLDWNAATTVACVLTDGYTPTIGQTWKFVDGATGVGNLPSDGFHPDGSRFDFYTYRDGVGAGWALYKDTVNNDVRLEYVPEPATMSILVLGGLALLRRKRS